MEPLKLPSTASLSRSAIVDREECDRLRLLKWDLDGTGYEPIQGSVATMSGIHIHEGFAALLDPVAPKSLEEAVAAMRGTYTEEFERRGIAQAVGQDNQRVLTEQLFMLEAMLRGWSRVRMAIFLEEYEVISVERAWHWELGPGLQLPLRMDAIVRRRADGLLFIVDFKGTGSGDAEWQGTHEVSRQTLLYLTALEEHTGEPVGGMLYEGIVRGRFAPDTAKSSPFHGQYIQQSSYCYAYTKRDPEFGMHEVRTDWTSAKGWQKFRVYEDYTAEAWVDILAARGELARLFVAGTPINPPAELRQSIRRQIAHEESQWFRDVAEYHRLRLAHGDEAPETLAFLETRMPQKTGRCTKYGKDHKCPFYHEGACFLKDFITNLPSDEGFAPRVFHHAGQESN